MPNNPSIAPARGVLSMARAMMRASAGSQFFAMHQDTQHLDGQYAAFGKVTRELETMEPLPLSGPRRRTAP